jgi:hypothetical protein
VLLYPLALLSGAAIVGLVGLVNGMFVFILLRRAGMATRWREVLTPLCIGAVLGIAELVTIGVLRDLITARFDLPI